VPSPTASSAGHRERGTASIELIAVVPFLLLAVLVAAQIGLAGYASWSAAVAARAGARAALVNGEARRVARRALPPLLRAGSRVDASDGVGVSVQIPRLLPAMPPLTVAAESELGDG
jgi:hypothetical protein